MSKVKHINFKYELEGNGIVNYDSGDQKFLWNRESRDNDNKTTFTSANNNNKYAKKVYFRDANGKLDYKIKISFNSLRNAIFSNDAIATNPSISHHKSLLNSFIGSVLGILRGYMFTSSTDNFKKSSPLTITDAIQTNNSVSTMEMFTRSGQKSVGDDSSDSDTTLFNMETIGNITYEGNGCIDLQNLEFLSADHIFDRYAFNSDDYSILEQFLKVNIPNFNSELGYYTLKTSAIDVAEYGIKFSDENMLFLIKEVLKRILAINITRSSSYAKLSKLSIELVYNPLNPSENVWVDINSIEDIDKLSFDIDESYILADETEVKKQREEIENILKKDLESKVIKKESKKSAKSK